MRNFHLRQPGFLSVLGLAIYCLAAEPSMAQGRIIRVTTTQAHRATIEQTEWAVGIIESRRSPQLAAEVAGAVVRVHVDEGQGVEAGQVLAEIDNEQYRLARDADNAEVGRLSALNRQKERELERGAELYKDNLIARDALDILEGDLEALKEQLIGARAKVADSERRLAETRLVAPVRAEISARNIDVGDYLQTGTVAFDLIDIDNLRVRLPFPEYRAPKIKKGLTVRLRSAAAGAENVVAEITDIRPSINPANRSMTVIVDFANPGAWRPGASVRAEVVLEVRDDVIMVPQVSVVRRPVGDVVYVLTNEVVEERPVQRGQRNGDDVEIKSGLSGGERVVVDGAGFLTGGSTVKVVEG
jgi:RND family efflux transporter MFP subunit